MGLTLVVSSWLTRTQSALVESPVGVHGYVDTNVMQVVLPDRIGGPAVDRVRDRVRARAGSGLEARGTDR